MAVPSIPLKEKVLICLGSFLLTLTIYLVIDLYTPLKQLLAGQKMTFSEVMAHFQLQKKALFIGVITVLVSRITIRKRNQKLADAAALNPQPQPH
ncbi:hypothetical protein EFA69_01805 [Rufibacter immobilis]|uniref:Uncharacterized protein n=1 Tax=Rufibacter immobilis TaxID=1348778 RepID=A0A3M9N614_9BACT|nr:hypothetical protein [Rufibacter immobilis]RNI33176.1 hypothetical protein EFA69_01805 [Rufibacter immobilis]